MTGVFIWGSCVSRDTFEYLPDDYRLLGYVARQSLLSAGYPAASADIGSVESSFQQRMIEGDLAGNALDLVRGQSARIDLLLLDLCDERLGVVQQADGGWVTRSVEKIASGAQARLDAEGRVLMFGEPEHVERWRLAAEAVRDQLHALGLLNRAVILAAEWALCDDEANASPLSFGVAAGEMNARFAPYYAILDDLGFGVVRIAPTLAASSHKWGRAAFHYHDVTYEEIVKAIHRVNDELSSAESIV